MTNAIILTGKSANPLLDQPWQMRAWRFYGAPDGSNINDLRLGEGAIGEVRYILGWIAQQVSRCGWRITIDGEEMTDDENEEMIATVASTGASTAITTNLLVAGELHYAAYAIEALEAAVASSNEVHEVVGIQLPGNDDTVWVPISVIEPHRDDLLKTAQLCVHGVWPHPGALTRPDPPLRGVLDVLEEIEQLQDVAHAQNNSRIAQMGILQVANEFDFVAGEEGSRFQRDLEETINAPIRDPRRYGASPILLRGPGDLIGQGIAHTQIGEPWDDRLDVRMMAAIRRLAWGFPLPPEALLGMTATNRATAFQIEDTTYRSHIEPIAQLVANIYAAALRSILDNVEGKRVEVEPDPTDLLARRHSVADAFSAYDRGLVSADWVREVIGVNEDDAATEEDLVRLERIGTGRGTGGRSSASDPAQGAEREGVQASLRALAELQTTEALAAAVRVEDGRVDLEELASALADLDQNLRASLTGAVDMAVNDTLRRVGARARTLAERSDAVVDPAEIADVPNIEVPSKLGTVNLIALDPQLEITVRDSLSTLADWWRDTKLPEVQAELEELLTVVGAEPTEPGPAFERSAELLLDGLTEWVLQNLDRWPMLRPDSDLVRDVVMTAGEVDA